MFVDNSDLGIDVYISQEDGAYANLLDISGRACYWLLKIWNITVFGIYFNTVNDDIWKLSIYIIFSIDPSLSYKSIAPLVP